MSKRNLVRIISFLAAAILICCGFIIRYYLSLRFYKNQVRYAYSEALSELNTSIDNIALNLEKAKYVTTNKQIGDIAQTVYTESKIAKASISKLPSSDKYGEKLNKFLAQVGNYSVYLARKAEAGKTIEINEKTGFEKLGEISKIIAESISELNRDYETSGKFYEKVSAAIENFDVADIPVSFTELEESLTDYPTLLYDGPYSDYIGLKTSKMLQSEPEITKEQAVKIISQTFSVSDNEISYKSLESGNIPSYHFAFGNATAAVSSNGGHLVYYRKYTEEQTALFTYEQAVSKARKFISEISGENFIPTYYFTDNGVCVVNFAYKNGAAICYADLIKIGIDMHTGEMVLYEARGYLANHSERTVLTPANTAEQAKEVLSDKLSVKSHALAIIPTPGGYEKQCWEFTCSTDDNSNIIVYVNTETLEEEQIFILIGTSGGTLVK